jgi:uncharacterized membrane protein/protein-disulfide isomerase
MQGLTARTRQIGARRLAFVAAIAAALGFVFAAYSTYDYAEQLDRRVHAVHCSFIPGLPVSSDGENPCKAALFSAYSAVLRATFWGGVPISLFAMGAFAFFFAFGLYLSMARVHVARRAHAFFAVTSLAPLGASIVMFYVTVAHLHGFCKLCVGIYVSSLVLAVAAVLAWRAHDRERLPPDPAAGRSNRGGWAQPVLWLTGLGVATALPALAYATSLPDYRPFLATCGKLAVTREPHNSLLKLPTAHPTRGVVLFEDPLCPTCRSFHDRLVDEGVFERLNVTLVMFPLDSECNWMLDRALHPGACLMAKAVLCGGDDKARAILEWSYDRQDDLKEAGKLGSQALLAKITERWGAAVSQCVGSAAAATRLNQNLHFAANNHIAISTPQMFLGDQRICDEDTDLGMKYTLAQLAPEVLP